MGDIQSIGVNEIVWKKGNNYLTLVYQIDAHFSKALDEARAEETKELKAKGYEPVLSKSRWLLPKRSEILSDSQEEMLAELLQYNFRSIRCYILKDEYILFWDYKSVHWAGKFMDQWCTKILRFKFEQMKKFIRMLRNHLELMHNWFWAKGQLPRGVVEGFNNKGKLTSRKSFGF